MADAFIDRDAPDPGADVRLAAKVAGLANDLDEAVLQDVFGGRPGAEDSVGHAEHHRRVRPVQRGVGVTVAVAGALQQGFIDGGFVTGHVSIMTHRFDERSQAGAFGPRCRRPPLASVPFSAEFSCCSA
jgi:hypothetical protein